MLGFTQVSEGAGLSFYCMSAAIIALWGSLDLSGYHEKLLCSGAQRGGVLRIMYLHDKDLLLFLTPIVRSALLRSAGERDGSPGEC